MRNLVLILFLFIISNVHSQQLNCEILINSDKVATTNNQIFRNLKNSISDFVNKTDWTGEEYKQTERIECSMVIIAMNQISFQQPYKYNLQDRYSTQPIRHLFLIITTKILDFDT